MPITKSAIKSLRQSKRKATVNRAVRSRVKTMSDAVVKEHSLLSLSKAYSAIDKALKKHVLHRNKAARLKSKVAKTFAK